MVQQKCVFFALIAAYHIFKLTLQILRGPAYINSIGPHHGIDSRIVVHQGRETIFGVALMASPQLGLVDIIVQILNTTCHYPI